jgi:succinate-semialdehyde dehydrogenase / glutarate-semialdehyde dehydrogenase
LLPFGRAHLIAQIQTLLLMIKSINPYTQQTIGEFHSMEKSTIDEKIRLALKAFTHWRAQTFDMRASSIVELGNVLRQGKENFALMITSEMGKTIREAKDEIDKCAEACDYFAREGQSFLKDMVVPTEASKSFVSFEPLGPVLAIMPWNFPFWQVFRFAVPAIMAGNVGLLKHASNVSGCSVEIEKIFLKAGFPEGVFQSLLVNSKDVEHLIADNGIRAVTLTGSEYAGTQVAAAAGKHLKKTVLELGGSDPFIVLEDADLDLAAKIGTQSRMRNAGQSCIAAKRFIVVEKVKEEFLQRFKQAIERLQQGNPLMEGVNMGPLARIDLAEELEKQLSTSVKQGAKVISGGMRAQCNFQPTLLDQVKPGMVAFDEELFGPIASVITVKDESEAVLMANQSRYGLGASVWTKDKERGERIARQLESGSVFINSLMRSDQRLPFGGVKKSGYGRELSELGIKEFVNAKTIYVQ